PLDLKSHLVTLVLEAIAADSGTTERRPQRMSRVPEAVRAMLIIAFHSEEAWKVLCFATRRQCAESGIDRFTAARLLAALREALTLPTEETPSKEQEAEDDELWAAKV
ncbi:unnamed protein product, partial [Polarella glacialis]